MTAPFKKSVDGRTSWEAYCSRFQGPVSFTDEQHTSCDIKTKFLEKKAEVRLKVEVYEQSERQG